MVIRTVRMIQIALLASIVMNVWVGERVSRKLPPNLTFYNAISFVAIGLIGAIFVVRRTLLAASEVQLRANPEDSALLARWKAAYIVIYVLCEALALLGLLLRAVGFPLSQIWAFYLASFALMLSFGPWQPITSCAPEKLELRDVH